MQANAVSPVRGEAVQDTAILFRFVPGKRMFYSTFCGNDKAIAEAVLLLDKHREAIEAGHAYVSIRGYCGSFGSKADNLSAAKNRSNQVKSWFIAHHGMKEAYYRTLNSTHSYHGIKDVVALLGVEYVEGYEPSRPSSAVGQADTLLAKLVVPEPTAEAVDTVSADTLSTLVPVAAEVSEEQPACKAREYAATPWYLKSNLLYDVLLMPSLEVAYRINHRWSVGVEGNMAWWHNNGGHKYYQLATIVPEARYWFKRQNNRCGHYLGLFTGGGWYDLENGGRGYQGEGVMVGVSYGYMFPVGRYFAFEAGVGVGFMHTWYEEYVPIDGHYVYQQSSRLSYFGPLKLKFAFVWNIGRWTEKGGRR